MSTAHQKQYQKKYRTAKKKLEAQEKRKNHKYYLENKEEILDQQKKYRAVGSTTTRSKKPKTKISCSCKGKCDCHRKH